MCETLTILKNMGAVGKKLSCPWIGGCAQNLSGENCELARTCEALDSAVQEKEVSGIKMDFEYHTIQR